MNNKIGVFDSGIGGLSIWNEIVDLLPNEDTIYLADSKNAPYGQKSKDEIIALCVKNTELLLTKRCKLIVVACNTATTNAINYLRANYEVPFVGIEPAIKSAALHSKTNKIGILATKGTLNSALFVKTSASIDNIEIIEQIGEGLVPLIESGNIESVEMTKLLTKYLKNLTTNGIDNLVLGCSHYPFLIPQIKAIIGTKINIVDSGEAVAKQTKKLLELNALLNTSKKEGKHELYSNLNPSYLAEFIPKNKNCKIAHLDF